MALEHTVLLGRAATFGHEGNDGLQDSPRTGCPCGEGGDGREESKGQLHTRLDGEVIEEIRNFVEWKVENWLGTTSSGVVGLAAAVLTLAGAFFLPSQWPA